MTPQEWIDSAKQADSQLENLWLIAEGAAHLASALEEIAERDAEIVGHRDEISLLHAKLSDAEEEIARLRADASTASPSCDRCQSAHCCSVTGSAVPPLCVTDPEGSMPLWMPWTNADVQARVDPLHAEIDRLRAEAGRVVVPELRGLTDEQAQAIADTFAIETTKYTVFRVWAIAQDQVACNGSVPAGRVLKDGEVAVGEAEWQAANQFITLQRKIDGGGDVDEEVEWHKGLIRAEKKLDALRTQATGEKDV